MVAITVLLAATAATFFLEIADNNDQRTPTAAFDFDYDADAENKNDTLQITHSQGDTLETANVYVTITGANFTDDSGSEDVDGRYKWADLTSNAPANISAGATVTVGKDSLDSAVSFSIDQKKDELSLATADVSVTWEDPDSPRSFTLSSW